MEKFAQMWERTERDRHAVLLRQLKWEFSNQRQEPSNPAVLPEIVDCSKTSDERKQLLVLTSQLKRGEGQLQGKQRKINYRNADKFIFRNSVYRAKETFNGSSDKTLVYQSRRTEPSVTSDCLLLVTKANDYLSRTSRSSCGSCEKNIGEYQGRTWRRDSKATRSVLWAA